jgi:hypothetical protein
MQAERGEDIAMRRAENKRCSIFDERKAGV